MPFEEIQIRINKEGFVYVDGRGIPTHRLRALSEHLEEVFGPRVEIITDPEEMPPQVINLSEERKREVEEIVGGDEEHESERERGRVGG